MPFDISPDTFFLGLISLFSMLALPMIRSYGKKICGMITRIETLELIALQHHPEDLQKFKEHNKK